MGHSFFTRGNSRCNGRFLALLTGAVGLVSCGAPLAPSPVPAEASSKVAKVKKAVPPETPHEGLGSRPRTENKEVSKPVAKGQIHRIELAELFVQREAGQVVMLDARPGFHYGLGHISGALSLPKRGFEKRFEPLRGELEAAKASGKVLVVYCLNPKCPDGYAVSRQLAERGFSSALYEGGWEEWKTANLD